jgi:DHA2 family multidrug resistance protein
VFATLLSRYTVQAKAALASHVAAGSTAVAARLGMMEQMFRSRGADAAAAHQSALQLMELTVVRQAMVLSFERLFLLAGFSFLAVLPLVWLLKGRPAGGADVHLEM